MEKYTRETLDAALKIINSVLHRCEKIQPKFMIGTSQHTLLENRIKALSISRSLMTEETDKDNYSKETLIEALRPIVSIIHKCEKAQLKFIAGSSQHTRFKNMIDAMDLSKEFIMNEISRRS